MAEIQTGEFRRSALIKHSTYEQYDYSGNTITASTTQYFDLKNAFTGATFTYAAITSAQLARLTDLQYQTRRNHFLSIVVDISLAQKNTLITSSEGTNSGSCPIIIS